MFMVLVEHRVSSRQLLHVSVVGIVVRSEGGRTRSVAVG